MAEAKPAENAAGGSSESLFLCDELVDMLMVLDFEDQFCTKELKPIPRTYFAIPAANTALQFNYFTQLVAWALRLINQEPNWDKYDDPHTVITTMQVTVQNLGVQVNVAPGKLRVGSGEGVCQLLHALFKEILRRRDFEWGAPAYPDEGLADEADVDSDAEIHSECDDGAAGDGEEDDLMYHEDEGKLARDQEEDDERAILEASVDPKEWLLELERVAPRLKIAMPNDAKEWRTHLTQTKSHKQVIEAQFPKTKAQLDKLSKELGGALERIRSKEAFINAQFQDRAKDHYETQEELTTTQAQYTDLNEVVMNRQIDLKSVTEDLEAAKSEMEERSSTVTDTAPIVKMKDSFKRLRADTRQLEVRIGVVNHTLLQAKLRQRPNEKGKSYGGGPGAAHPDEYNDDEDN